ncbi:MAG: efflux RND transporter periplasmic adaptor subunit [Bacillota bacterium]
MRKWRWLTAVLLVAALVLAAGCGKKDADTGNSQDKVEVPVSVEEVRTGSISSTTTITGKVTPLAEINVVPKTGGKVAQVLVDVGSKVKQGQVLVRLDTAELDAQLKQATAALELARSSNAQNQLRLQDAQNNLNRMQALYNEGAISKQQYETALLQYNLTKNTDTGAQVKQAQANVELIRTQISNAIITAPQDGEISARLVDPGEMAGPGVPVVTIVNTAKVYVEGIVAEKDIALVKKGQQVDVKVEAAGGAFKGVVETVSPAADPRSKGYPLKVALTNPDSKLKPGMFGEIRLVTGQKDDVVVIPKEVVVDRGAGKVVFVVKGGMAEERKITLGMESGDRVEVVDGIKAGEKLVVAGQASLTDKSPVKVQEEK